MSSFILPIIVSLIILYGFYKKIDVFQTFIIGVQNGLEISLKILPTLVGLITAVFMFRASGGIDLLSNFASPIMEKIKIPPECTPLMILKPISGGGGMAIFSDILKNYGADSYIGRISAVMMASSETSFYTMSIYYGSLGINTMRHTLYCVMLADFMAFLASAYVVRWLFY